MSAQSVYDTAPLGSLIRFSNSEPRPPARFTRKVNAWNQDNGIGRLVLRTPERISGNYRSPASFALHLGNYGSQGLIAIVVTRHYSIDSPLNFEVAEMPKPGMVRILTSFGGRDELRFLAPDMAAAEAWLARNHYSNVRLECVSDPDLVVASTGLGRAA